VELTGPINFVPVLVLQQRHINGEKKNTFLVCEVAVLNTFILSNTDKKERVEKLQTHIVFCKILITNLTGNVTKTGKLSSSDKTGKIHFIIQKENMSTKESMVFSYRQVMGVRQETSLQLNMLKKTWLTFRAVLQKILHNENYEL
jgi:hypothetical protein